jgi:hypothetical protein
MHTKFWSEALKEINYFGDTDIHMNLKEILYEGADWIYLAEEGD